MLPVYIFTVIVGLGILALGTLGGDGGADELDIAGLDAGDAEASLNGEADGSWRKVLSIRSLSYFMAGLGATGLLLTLIGTEPLLTAFLAMG